MREHNRCYDPVTASIMALSVVGAAGISANQQAHATTAAKNAQRDQVEANAKAIADVQAAQDTASNQAIASVQKRRATMTQTTFTNPLGIGDTASVARKTLLGQ